MENGRMKWAFLLGSPDISGGSFVIYEHALGAKRRGHEVCIVTQEPVDMDRLFWHPEARSLRWETFESISGERVDAAIATFWVTAYDLHRVDADKYLYFVQSIESRFYPDEMEAIHKYADATYMLPLVAITEASWIKEHLRENYGMEAILARNGIRKDIYTPEGEAVASRIPGRLRVLVEGPLRVSHKNVERTLRLCRKSNADEVWLMTLSPIEKHRLADKVFSKLTVAETAKVYRSCDVIVKLSYVEGMFGPPLEMFHCGGTAVTYNVSGLDEYVVNGENALVAEKDDEEAVIRHINNLRADFSLLERLKGAALVTAASWPDWEEASLGFEHAVKSILERPGLPSQRMLLERKSAFFHDFYALANKRGLGAKIKSRLRRASRIPLKIKRRFID